MTRAMKSKYLLGNAFSCRRVNSVNVTFAADLSIHTGGSGLSCCSSGGGNEVCACSHLSGVRLRLMMAVSIGGRRMVTEVVHRCRPAGKLAGSAIDRGTLSSLMMATATVMIMQMVKPAAGEKNRRHHQHRSTVRRR